MEILRRQNMPTPGFTSNTAINGRPPIYFPSSNIEQAQNAPSTPAQNPSIID